jgi:tellurite methyltransferase
MTPKNVYDEKYAGDEYYWTTEPSAICHRVVEIVQPSKERKLKLIDLGCGEGRNAVFFATHGFDVLGLDLSAPGLEKMRRLADEQGVPVATQLGDIRSFELQHEYAVVFSTGALHYMPPEIRRERYAHFKQMTRAGGVNALSVFVNKPFIAEAPDAEATAHQYHSGELLGYYWDWEVVYTTEEIFDCNSSGIPHRHAVNRVIARKP